MIVRASDGSIVEVKRADYKDDGEYYSTIMTIVTGRRPTVRSTSFIDKAADIIKRRPYK